MPKVKRLKGPRRPRSQATLAALFFVQRHISQYGKISKKELGMVAMNHGIHIATLYRALSESKGLT